MLPAAFFDLDGTLLLGNTGKLWVRRERREGRVTALQMLQAGWYLLGYRFGLVGIEGALAKALRTIEGDAEDELAAAVRRWYADEVAPLAAPGAFAVVEEHREAGHRLVVLTSSSPWAAEEACRQFGLQHALSMRYEVRDGRFSGRPERPVCYGEGKVAVAERFAAEHGVDLDGSWFYSDSITDRPMLERVAHPVAVSPDTRLRRLARRRGWPVVSWEQAP
jgi:HAD superfamily hydrolase (TIGR01490 family)